MPHLAGAYESAPYLHDGRAATIDEVFTKYNGEHRYGKAETLKPAQLRDLMEYIPELSGRAVAASNKALPLSHSCPALINA